MFAEKHYPDFMAPEQLDAYLAKGWYRMGQTIFTTHFLCFGEQFYSALWIRLPLQGYRFRKSLRKTMRKNDSCFTTHFRKAYIDREKEVLYQRYKANFPGLLAPTLRDSLLDGEDFNIYNTFEVAVYADRRLVAASFFDLGRESAASIMGMYDPAYAKYSLGFFTMLKEIEFCLEHGFLFYYPGYVVPGYQRFDYKIRIGKEVEYYDLGSNQWHPYHSLNEEHIPLQKMQRRLGGLQEHLRAVNIRTDLRYYPLFEANLFGFWRTHFFDYPLFLLCPSAIGHQSFLICIYNVRDEQYHLLHCVPFDDIQFYFNETYTRSFTRDEYFMDLLVTHDLLEKSCQPESLVRSIQQQQGSASR